MQHKYLLSPGHGGILWDQYLTPGKRSPEIGEGVGIYEGGFNRDVAARIAEHSTDIDVLVTGPVNVPLRKRINYANELYEKVRDLIYIPIHANAWGESGWSKPHGHRILVAPTASRKSRLLARCIDISFREMYDNPTYETIRTRTFDELVLTKMPAVYVETMFMTNRRESAIMATDEGRQLITQIILNGLLEFDKV